MSFFAVLLLLVGGMIIGYIIGYLSRYDQSIINQAKIWVISSSRDDLIRFLKFHINDLDDKTTNILLSRIEELNADEIINGDLNEKEDSAAFKSRI